jgi:hypothetical protein
MKKWLTTLLAVVMVLSMILPAAALAEEAKPAPGGTIAAEPFAENVKITIPVYDRSKEGYPPLTTTTGPSGCSPNSAISTTLPSNTWQFPAET